MIIEDLCGFPTNDTYLISKIISPSFTRLKLAIINLKDTYESCHNGFPLDLDDLKNKWSRHRSFLYGCDRSPGIHVLKLGTEIPNLTT